MPTNRWPDEPGDQYADLGSLLSDLADTDDDPDYDDLDNSFRRGQGGRRRKAAFALTVIWAVTIILHLVSWGTWFIVALTTLLSIHAVRVFLAKPLDTPRPLPSQAQGDEYPYVSILVAAKNEEAVIANLVRSLCDLDYPADRYDLWVIDDNSTDRTPLVLNQLAKEYASLNVVRRGPNATGGKSGALNQVWPCTQADIIAVFDADAQVSSDILLNVVPLFERSKTGAVQLRKAILQAEPDVTSPLASNFWIKGQRAEMALDTFYQQQRIAVGGIGELRGNGQFVRRQALEACGGWNEETITDDLDLTLRLHLRHWNIDFLATPPVREEGVTTLKSLWHQRSRWAEGGYQRYLDYWRLILQNRLGFRKTYDLLMFLLIQYCLPTAAVPDMMMAILRNRLPLLGPITTLSVTLSVMGTYIGLRRIQKAEAHRRFQDAAVPSLPLVFITFLQAIRGTLYMLHWLPVVASTAMRMSVRPKTLKWVKTIHHGTGDLWLEMQEESEKTA